MSCTPSRQKSDSKTRRSLPPARLCLMVLLMGIAVFSLGFWSKANGPGRGVSAIRMRVMEVSAPASAAQEEYPPLAVRSGPLYVPSPAAPAAMPMSLDRTQYRAAIRSQAPHPVAPAAYAPLPDNRAITFTEGEVGLRTSAGLLPVRGLSLDILPGLALDDAFTANLLNRALLPGVPLTDAFSAFPARNDSALEDAYYETALGGLCRIPSPYMTAFGFDEARFLNQLAPTGGRMRLRADKYRDLVFAASQRFNLSQDLIFGIMRTESAFNPFAVSNAGALGLMQLMPGTAGGEVHSFLGKENDFSGSLLFDPAHNIQYGCAYLYILGTRYFQGVRDENARQLCIIAAYNAGPGAVLRVFDRNQGQAIDAINALTADEVYRTLTTQMPALETRQYVDKVLGHMRTDYAG